MCVCVLRVARNSPRIPETGGKKQHGSRILPKTRPGKSVFHRRRHADDAPAAAAGMVVSKWPPPSWEAFN